MLWEEALQNGRWATDKVRPRFFGSLWPERNFPEKMPEGAVKVDVDRDGPGQHRSLDLREKQPRLMPSSQACKMPRFAQDRSCYGATVRREHRELPCTELRMLL